jgi:hypothetical protein
MVQFFKSFFVLAALATVGFAAPNHRRDVGTLETDLGNVYNQCTLISGALTAFIQSNTVVSFLLSCLAQMSALCPSCFER